MFAIATIMHRSSSLFDVFVYKKRRSGLSRVYPGRPGSGSTGFHRANSQTGFCLDLDRSQARVGRVPGRPAGPVRVSKHWYGGQGRPNIDLEMWRGQIIILILREDFRNSLNLGGAKATPKSIREDKINKGY